MLQSKSVSALNNKSSLPAIGGYQSALLPSISNKSTLVKPLTQGFKSRKLLNYNSAQVSINNFNQLIDKNLYNKISIAHNSQRFGQNYKKKITQSMKIEKAITNVYQRRNIVRNCQLKTANFLMAFTGIAIKNQNKYYQLTLSQSFLLLEKDQYKLFLEDNLSINELGNIFIDFERLCYYKNNSLKDEILYDFKVISSENEFNIEMPYITVIFNPENLNSDKQQIKVNYLEFCKIIKNNFTNYKDFYDKIDKLKLNIQEIQQDEEDESDLKDMAKLIYQEQLVLEQIKEVDQTKGNQDEDYTKNIDRGGRKYTKRLQSRFDVPKENEANVVREKIRMQTKFKRNTMKKKSTFCPQPSGASLKSKPTIQAQQDSEQEGNKRQQTKQKLAYNRNNNQEQEIVQELVGIKKLQKPLTIKQYAKQFLVKLENHCIKEINFSKERENALQDTQDYLSQLLSLNFINSSNQFELDVNLDELNKTQNTAHAQQVYSTYDRKHVVKIKIMSMTDNVIQRKSILLQNSLVKTKFVNESFDNEQNDQKLINIMNKSEGICQNKDNKLTQIKQSQFQKSYQKFAKLCVQELNIKAVKYIYCQKQYILETKLVQSYLDDLIVNTLQQTQTD